MDDAINRFRTNIAWVRALGGIHRALCTLTTPALDPTDLLRAQFVLVVGVLDYYVHEVVRLGMLDVYEGHRPPTNAFRRFMVSTEGVMAGATTPGFPAWFEDEIRERHGHLSFQQPERIADAIRLFSPCELWPSVRSVLGLPATDVKTRLDIVVDRRNKIAHEADPDPSYPGARWPITAWDADSTIDFIERLCEAIHSIVA